VEIHTSDIDIRRYLKGRIESEGQLVYIVKVDLALQATIINTIVENSKGM
jgi:hypothetical protein